MTVSSTASAVTYAANGSTTVWPFAFPILADGDAQVIVTDTSGLEAVLLPSTYTISGVGDSGGGSVTYPKTGSPLTTGNKLTIRRKTAITQPVDLGPGAIWPEVHEAAFDRITLVAQELQEQLDRTPKVPLASGDDPNALLAGTAAAAAASAQAAQAAAATAVDQAAGAINAARAAQEAAASAQALVGVTIDPDPALTANSDLRLPPQSAVRAYVGTAVAGANAAAAAAQAAAQAVAQSAVPVGVVVPFAGAVAPPSYLFCNGAAVSRTAYAALFVAIGTTFGVGDGSTTFELPDLRGVFVRGLDGARGLDVDRAGAGLGTYQADAFATHTHGVPSMYSNTGGSYTVPSGGTAKFIQNTQATGGAETRPKNVALNYIIKY